MRALPEDIDTLLSAANVLPTSSIQRGCAVSGAILRICRELEPDVDFQDRSDRNAWLQTVAKLELIAAGQDPFHPKGEELWSLASLAKKGWRAPSDGPTRRFPFIADKRLRIIAERDYGSMVSARKIDDAKVAVVMAGCTAEAALRDFLERDRAATSRAAAEVKAKRASDGRWKKLECSDLDRWSLYNLIVVSGPEGLGRLGERTVKQADLLRDWRNYVHPAVERSEEALTSADAMAAEALLESVIEELQKDPQAFVPAAQPGLPAEKEAVGGGARELLTRAACSTKDGRGLHE